MEPQHPFYELYWCMVAICGAGIIIFATSNPDKIYETPRSLTSTERIKRDLFVLCVGILIVFNLVGIAFCVYMLFQSYQSMSPALPGSPISRQRAGRSLMVSGFAPVPQEIDTQANIMYGICIAYNMISLVGLFTNFLKIFKGHRAHKVSHTGAFRVAMVFFILNAIYAMIAAHTEVLWGQKATE